MLVDVMTMIAARIAKVDLITPGIILGTAFICALVAYWKVVEKKSLRGFFEFAFPAEVMTHPSARADLLFWITKKLAMPFLAIPAGVTFVTLMGYATNKVVGGLFGIETPLIEGPAGPITVVMFTITMLLAYDISYYSYHYVQHKVPFLWELHKVHHSAEVMVGITKDRVHPLDDLINRAWDGVVAGFCFGLWTLIALDPVEVTVFGVSVYLVRNILMMDFVRHTHFKISFGPLNNIILCPHWHQLHHSVDPRHYDKNFGLLFSFWDRLFGTLFVPAPGENFKFGLMDRDVRDYQSLQGLWIRPLRKMTWQLAKISRRFRGRISNKADAAPAEPQQGG
ncbi:sterol desaturase family protein [Rhizobium oryzicola]|uniref:Sterol desaturase family protein n=1 Tax=Rhizobium oryzicola TaxID=1232668 RepID=A0ABT8SWN3_9HYPH|nr:sterol desaturase family protein [Rhizobium oryzicola]MDO1582837.1 sterol desaturase family protein [Rhizobium oryzicola]